MNGRRPERTAGVLLVVTTVIKKMMLKEWRDPATTSENVVHKGVLNRPVDNKHHADLIFLFFFTVSFLSYANWCHYVFTERITGGDQPQMKDPPGETLAERSLTAMIIVTGKIAVAENAEMTVKTEAHPEVMMKVSRT